MGAAIPARSHRGDAAGTQEIFRRGFRAYATGRDVDSRAAVLAALESVDFLTIFEETTPLEIIRAVRPDVLVKGADYSRDEVVGADFVESYGGRLHLARLHAGFSTTGLLRQLGAA